MNKEWDFLSRCKRYFRFSRKTCLAIKTKRDVNPNIWIFSHNTVKIFCNIEYFKENHIFMKSFKHDEPKCISSFRERQLIAQVHLEMMHNFIKIFNLFAMSCACASPSGFFSSRDKFKKGRRSRGNLIKKTAHFKNV